MLFIHAIHLEFLRHTPLICMFFGGWMSTSVCHSPLVEHRLFCLSLLFLMLHSNIREWRLMASLQEPPTCGKTLKWLILQHKVQNFSEGFFSFRMSETAASSENQSILTWCQPIWRNAQWQEVIEKEQNWQGQTFWRSGQVLRTHPAEVWFEEVSISWFCFKKDSSKESKGVQLQCQGQQWTSMQQQASSISFRMQWMQLLKPADQRSGHDSLRPQNEGGWDSWNNWLKEWMGPLEQFDTANWMTAHDRVSLDWQLNKKSFWQQSPTHLETQKWTIWMMDFTMIGDSTIKMKWRRSERNTASTGWAVCADHRLMLQLSKGPRRSILQCKGKNGNAASRENGFNSLLMSICPKECSDGTSF